jgi:hypothetical protein
MQRSDGGKSRLCARSAKAADRREAASQIAEFFLPKHTGGKKPRRGKFPPDEFGFAVDPEVARELRDSKMKLSCLQQKAYAQRVCAKGQKPSRTNSAHPAITPMPVSFKIRR